MPALEAATIYGVQIRESADDGSDFSNAAADYRILFVGEDGSIKLKDSAGTVTTPGGGAASNLIHTIVTRTNIGANVTFSSTTHVPVDTTNLAITETFRAGVIIATFTCRWSHSSGTGTGSFSFEVDGTNVAPSTSVNGLYHQQVAASGISTACILVFPITLSAGSHTIKPTVKTSGATLTVHQTAATDVVTFSVTELYAV